MKISPMIMLGGLAAAVGIGVLAMSNKAAAAPAGGPGLQLDPSMPFDCTSNRSQIVTMYQSLCAQTKACQATPNAPGCSGLAAGQQSFGAIVAYYQQHCPDPLPVMPPCV